jgi:hypothetical protein
MKHRAVGFSLQYGSYLCWVTSLHACLAFQVTYTSRVSRDPFITTRLSAQNDNDSQQSLSSDIADDSLLTSLHANMNARDVATTCMDALLQNDSPRKNSGLEVCFDFSSDRCRAALGGSVEDFILYASNPTFGSMTNAKEYIVLSVGRIIPATMTRGAMQTVLIKVTPSKGDYRTFLW